MSQGMTMLRTGMILGTEGMATEEGAVDLQHHLTHMRAIQGIRAGMHQRGISPKAVLVPLMVVMMVVTALTRMKKMMMKKLDAE